MPIFVISYSQAHSDLRDIFRFVEGWDDASRYFLSPSTRIGLREVNIPTLQRSYHPFNCDQIRRKSPVHQSTMANSLCSNSGFCRGMAPDALCVQSIGRNAASNSSATCTNDGSDDPATGSFYVRTITWHLTNLFGSTTPRSKSSSDHRPNAHDLQICRFPQVVAQLPDQGLWLGDTDTGKGFSDCSLQTDYICPRLE